MNKRKVERELFFLAAFLDFDHRRGFREVERMHVEHLFFELCVSLGLVHNLRGKRSAHGLCVTEYLHEVERAQLLINATVLGRIHRRLGRGFVSLVAQFVVYLLCFGPCNREFCLPFFLSGRRAVFG